MVDARSRYLKKMHTPTPFSQGPEMQNYTQMMNLQNQASNFAPNDPRIQELKDRRRTYNRFDKYKIGDKFNVAPLDVQKDFSNRSNNFRNAAPNVYGKMYPLQDMAMRYGQSGGLLGLIAKEMFGKVSDFGKSMVNREGIAGAADTDEGEMEDYAAKTFGMDGVPYPQQDFGQQDLTPEIRPEIRMELGEPYTADIEETLLYDENLVPNVAPFIDKNTRNEVFDEDVDDLPVNTINNTRTIPGLIIPQFLDNQDDFVDGPAETAPPKVINEPLPFDEGKEAYIRKQNEYNPIRRSTFVAPFDDYDPDQFRFDNYDEYYDYLRKKRGIGEFIDDYYKGFTYDPRVDGIPLDYIPSAPDLGDR
jgi:hypothetical protein